MIPQKEKILVIVGPTASGKTMLSIELAMKTNGEIISADSMQVYKGLNIGTAKPTPEEMKKIKHHLIDIISPNERFSVADYVLLAQQCIKDVISRGKTPIICGGTGLYIDSLLSNTKFSKSECNLALRDALINIGRQYGGQVLLNKLSEFDKQSAQRLHKNDLLRIARAIEIYYTTHKTLTDHIKESRMSEPKRDYIIIGLNYKDRLILYDRINTRVDQMINAGLENEVRGLLRNGINISWSNAIGYKELYGFIEGSYDLETAVDLIKRNTRRYAKRQLTWFRRNNKINWIYIDTYQNFEEVYHQATKILCQGQE